MNFRSIDKLEHLIGGFGICLAALLQNQFDALVSFVFNIGDGAPPSP